MAKSNQDKTANLLRIVKLATRDSDSARQNAELRSAILETQAADILGIG